VRLDFASVQLVTEPQASERGVVHVVLPSGERMTIGEGTSVDLLRSVVPNGYGTPDVVLTTSKGFGIYVATGATDLRLSVDGLGPDGPQTLRLDPLSRLLFLRS
jgi:hypothetical protein